MDKKEEVICERCNGTGFITDEKSHQDVCPVCLGLGTIIQNKEKITLTRSKSGLKKNVIWTLIALSIYYVIFFFFYIQGDLNILVTVVILIAGHMAAISYIVGYMIIKSLPRL